MTRQRLPARRQSLLLTVEHEGATYEVGLGFYGSGQCGELFISGSKAGSGLDALLSDAAILISRGLQRGDTLDGLSQAMGRCGDKTTPASVLGAILDAAAQR